MSTKCCSKCGETKPRADYHRNRTRRDGHENRCKECACEKSRVWYDGLSVYEVSRRSMKSRRQKALVRMRDRNNKEAQNG